MIFINLNAVLYHNDSLESTSEHCAIIFFFGFLYIIMTRWSQLQNEASRQVVCKVPYIIMTRWSQLQNLSASVSVAS